MFFIFFKLQELASRIKFTEIVTRLEKASVTTNLEQKKKIVSKFFNAILNLQKELKAEEGPEAVISGINCCTKIMIECKALFLILRMAVFIHFYGFSSPIWT